MEDTKTNQKAKVIKLFLDFSLPFLFSNALCTNFLKINVVFLILQKIFLRSKKITFTGKILEKVLYIKLRALFQNFSFLLFIFLISKKNYISNNFFFISLAN